jgi:hypothetical protein
LKRALCLLLLILLSHTLFGQEPAAERNPLVDLRDEVKTVLADGGAPFTEEQEKAIALMMEDRRQASEDLFGQLMDYRSGPVQGQQQDRAVAAIQWMQNEFKRRLSGFLTPEQTTIWERHEKEKETTATQTDTAAAPAQQQTQLIRINNNMFTAEGPCFGCVGERTEVIQRGGIGAFHGNVNFDFKDESLNARNPFAQNRPPYQQRTTNVSVNGPFIRNKLTANVGFNHLLQESADTIHAIKPEGPFDLGISHPYTDRYVYGGGTFQLSDRHSLIFSAGQGRYLSRNQGIGGFNLPDRASTGSGRYWNMQLRQFSVFSPKTIYETRFNYFRNHDETKPATDGLAINVLDAFSSGGAQNEYESDRKSFGFSNLFSRIGTALTLKMGSDANIIKSQSLSRNNFIGSFTFSDLDAYLDGKPSSYSVTRGNPLLDISQVQWSLFIQADIKLTQRLTTMLGLRFEDQTNLHDNNNFGPRFGFAYAVNRSTVIRGGTGIFYQRLWDYIVQNQRRLDGTRQYQIVISDPSYPDPFQSGTVTVIPPASVRVTDSNLATPYEAYSSIAVEKTFRNNFFVSAKYDFTRGVRQYRSRNLNAPLPGQTTVPDPNRGNIWNLESTGYYRYNYFNTSIRERFSIFNVSASYNFNRMYNDNDGPFGVPSDNYNLRHDWGHTINAVHSINNTINAKLFFGIFLTETMSANSGNRYNITTGNDDNNDTVFNDRPPNVMRNSGDGPRYINFNFNISKAFFIGEKPDPGRRNGAAGSQSNLNFYANMTNAFNRTNYGTPSGVITSPFFGKSFNARPAREVQVGLRYQF